MSKLLELVDAVSGKRIMILDNLFIEECEDGATLSNETVGLTSVKQTFDEIKALIQKPEYSGVDDKYVCELEKKLEHCNKQYVQAIARVDTLTAEANKYERALNIIKRNSSDIQITNIAEEALKDD